MTGTALRREDPPAGRTPRTAPARLGAAALAAAVVVAAGFPALRAGFWSWDWFWVDNHARGLTAWGSPLYDLGDHTNALPLEIQWYRAGLAVLGQHPTAHHLMALVGLLLTLGVLYGYLRRLGLPGPAAGWAVVLAGVAPAPLSAWVWFAAAPHLWAALLGLGAALAHLAWRQRGSRAGALAGLAPVLAVLGLATKADAVVGPLLVLAWEWLGPRSARRPGRVAVSAVALAPVLLFLAWQATAEDPHRENARTEPSSVAGNALGILRFAFLWRRDAELRAEFPPDGGPPAALAVAGTLVGLAVLVLAAVSLRTAAGRVLVAAGLASVGPFTVLQPVPVSRYVLPPVLLLTAAAGAGAAVLLRRAGRPRRRDPRAVAALLVAVATVGSWGTLTHLAADGGAVAVREEDALLAGLGRAGVGPADRLAVRLVDSPLEPSTAGYRQLDPELPAPLRLRGVRFLRPGEPVPAGMRPATATRSPAGTYEVVIAR